MKRIVVATAAIVVLAVSAIPSPHARASTERSGPQATASKAPPAADLDTLLAPIALYPDQLLAQMLLAAANPGTIGTLHEWLLSHEGVKGTELQEAAAAAGFGESYVALVLFPDVIAYMASQAQWTARLGQAFAADRSAVFASIQRLRTKAKNAGTLKSTPQQQVETKTTSGGEQVIVIEPSNPQIVYVPQYNPQTVYTQSTSSTVVIKEDSSTDEAVAAGLIGFTAGIAIGAAMDNNYYYGPYGWHGGAYMYNDAWDDYYDAREDAREDWTDHREDMADERSDRAENAQEQRSDRTKNAQEQRTDRAENRQGTRTDAQSQRASGQTQRAEQASGAQAGTASATSATTRSSQESRGYSRGTEAGARSGTKSDAFSNYSSGKSERAASQRGQRSRSSSRGGGSRRR